MSVPNQVFVGVGVVADNPDDLDINQLRDDGLEVYRPIECGTPNMFIALKGKVITMNASEAFGEFQEIDAKTKLTEEEFDDLQRILQARGIQTVPKLIVYVYVD